MNQRLKAISALVPSGTILADIGTDHGYLPIDLVKRGICPKAYACDVAEGPLSAAKTNIASEHLEGKVFAILSDGFNQVPEDADCAVIAGMGWYTAQAILERAEERLPSFRRIIVQVNGDTDLLRKWISDRRKTIHEECMVNDRGKVYTAVSFSMQEHAPYADREILLGPCLLNERSPLFLEDCQKQAELLSMILSKRPEDETAARLSRRLAIYESVNP
ncbi:MAG: class I SAM-dependent methyltransferase [Solobacterium sp.]|jgi:tRNA (adenine22-N1)-methyltransferase|nr:class I SAM-dependent methyltransferase [Solobacterium sp.]